MRFELIHHDLVDSTSERAFAAIATGTARHGDVHVAHAQTNGRGRFGRTWFSPPGEGLYMSVVLLPPAPWNAPALTIASGLSLFDAAAKLGVTYAWLKWPNDLMCGGKIAGVLVETRGLDPERPHYVVGIGLNVRQQSFPPELDSQRRCSSLARLGLSTTIEQARLQVLREFSRRIEQIDSSPGQLASDYLRAAHLDRYPVQVRVGEDDFVGNVIDLSIDEGILLQGNDGEQRWMPLAVIREIKRA